MFEADIEEFILIPVHLSSVDGVTINPLDNLLHKCSVRDSISVSVPWDVGRIACELLLLQHQKQLQNDEIVINFLKRIQFYPRGIESLTQSTYLHEIFSHVENHHNQALISTVLEIILSLTSLEILSGEIVPKILEISLKWVSHDSLEVSNSAEVLLYKIALLSENTCNQVVEGITEQLKKSESKDTTIRLRYLGIFSQIMASGNETLFAICIRYGATELVLSACEIQDILAQMIALDFLPSIMSCRLGLDFLTTTLVPQIFPPMSHLEWIVNASSENGDEYLRAQCLSCTATLLSSLERIDHPFRRKNEDTTSSYFSKIIPSFLTSVSNLLESNVESERLSALSSLTTFATSSATSFLNALSHPNLLDNWTYLLRAQPTLQGPVLHSIAQVLLYPYLLNENYPTQSNVPIPPPPSAQSIPPIAQRISHSFQNLIPNSDDVGSSISSTLAAFYPLKKAIFDRIGIVTGKGSIDYLIKSARQPIPEIKIGAIDVLRSLAYQDNIWGLQTLMGSIGFNSYLQDRTTEYSKDGKDWKFTLIWSIYCSPNSDLLSEDVMLHIRRMLSQGPYFMPPRLEEPMTEEKGN